MGLIQADPPQRFHGAWTWARTGRSKVDLEGSMLDIRFIIIKSYLTAIWARKAHGFQRGSTLPSENGIRPTGRRAARERNASDVLQILVCVHEVIYNV